MNKISFVFVILFLCCSGGSKKYNIVGKLPNNNYDNRYIYLVEKDLLHANKPLIIDSTLIQNAGFIFRGELLEVPQVFHLVINEKQPDDLYFILDAPIIVESGDIEIVYDENGVSVKGGIITNDYNRLILNSKRDIAKRTSEIIKERSSFEESGTITYEMQNEFSARIRALYDNHMEYHTQFVKDNINNNVGWSFFFNYPIDRYEESVGAELYAAIPDTIRTRYEHIQKEKRDKQDYFQNSAKQTEIGFPFREVKGQDFDGNDFALSDIAGKGKVILIDVWASWCVPCIMEFKHLKEIHEKYKDKDLVILGVSLDEKESVWKNSVEKHELPWKQISSLEGWDTGITRDYGIQAIPFTIVIDKDGRIAGRNPHAHVLDKCLKVLLE